MTRPINASVFVPAFSPTGNPGEYLFELAEYTNAADTGNGAYDVVEGGLLYVPAQDLNTAMPIPGVVHRYRITQLTVVDSIYLSGTILWDELGDESDAPMNGVHCIYSEPTALKKLGQPISEALYPQLNPGSTIAALVVDLRNILDLIGGDFKIADDVAARDAIATQLGAGLRLGSLIYTVVEDTTWQYLGGGNWKQYKPKNTKTLVQPDPEAEWIFEHNMDTTHFSYSVFDATGNAVIPDNVQVLDSNTAKLFFGGPMSGHASFVFDLN